MKESRKAIREFFSELVLARDRLTKASEKLSAAYESVGVHSVRPGQGTGAHGKSDPTAAAAMRISECYDRYRKAMSEYEMAMARVKEVLKLIPPSRERTVLYEHYIDGMPIYRIAMRHRWNDRWVYVLHRNGLDEAGEIIKEIFGGFEKNT